jgi:hypothetical protein
MRIHLVPVGIMKKYINEMDFDTGADIDASTLIKRLSLPDKLKTVCFIGGKRVDSDYRFADGDVIKLVSTFAGG